jgi:DNA-binding NarL/FixJ family response regulator
MLHNRVAVIDDDPFVVAHLRRAFAEKLPGVEVDGVNTPMAPAGYDVYIVDKDFEGASLGHDVISRIRDLSPQALVVAYSSFLDRDFLRALLLRRCAGAFDKGSLEELEDMMAVIGRFLADQGGRTRQERGLRSTLRAISSLLHEWNLRLEQGPRGVQR